MSELPPPPKDPPPGWPATGAGGGPAWTGGPLPPPPSRGPGSTPSLLIGIAIGAGVVVSVVLFAIVLAGGTGSGGDRAAPTTSIAPSGESSPTTWLAPDEIPDDELLEAIPPLEHDFDFYGEVGTCINAETFLDVSCEQDHAGEVFARLEVPGEQYPGAEVLRSEHAALCEAEFIDLAGETPAERGLVVVGSQPTDEAWDDGLHDIVCMAMAFTGAPNVGSIADGT